MPLKWTWYPLSVSKGIFSPSWSVNFLENAPPAITDFSNLNSFESVLINVSFALIWFTDFTFSLINFPPLWIKSSNIFFKNEKFAGIIDFYFSCYDFYSFEIAICLNALCFDGKNENLSFNVTKARKFIKGYTSVRKISGNEKKYLKVLAQGASMRFLLTRVFDYLKLRKGSLLTVKDPIEYLRRLEFHNSVKSFEDYCI